MELTIKTRNAQVSDRQRAYIQEKLGKLGRHIEALSRATVEVAEENRRGQGTVQRVQVTLLGDHGLMLRAEQIAADIQAAVDGVQETLQRQIHRYKEKNYRRGKLRRQGGEFIAADPALAEAPEDAPRIVRTKQFAVKPMFSDEALEQMELLGHDFFVFRDAETSVVNVLYRRKDGHYGLIVPEFGV